MREEISEPQYWRSNTRSGDATGGSWVARRRAAEKSADLSISLPAEVVDAAFADESISAKPVHSSRRDLASPRSTVPADVAERNNSSEDIDFFQSLSDQLAMLQTQQRQLQSLLAQARDSSG